MSNPVSMLYDNQQPSEVTMKFTNYFGYIVYEDGTVLSKVSNKPMKIQVNYKGYPCIGFQINKRKVNKTIHRLLAELFIPNPYNFSDVDHIDGDRTNNNLSNLRWVTHGDNIQHSYNFGKRSATGINNVRCKNNESIVREVCIYLQSGLSAAKIRDLGYNYGLVRAIKSRKNWNHISRDYSW